MGALRPAAGSDWVAVAAGKRGGGSGCRPAAAPSLPTNTAAQPLFSHRPPALPLLLLQVGTVQLQQRPPKGSGFLQTLPAALDQAVKVSLHDCLACSGCVTSAETVLLQHQSTGELMQRLADPGWTVVMSLSPQSVASLAALHQLPAAECAARLAAFLRRLGVRAVFDIAASRQLALAEAAQEFMQRYRQSQRGAQALSAASSSPSEAAAAAAALGGDAMDLDAPPPAAPSSSSGGSGTDSSHAAGPLPMLASACPGWVCYAEKTHGEHVLPYISTGGLQHI